ncbi:type VI secretion protein [Streptomyces sp. 4N509B]|uniref:type VI secretion protein n=1 Tax=Streptomyces sp. 4N509B TaxID=3457413 RepID=UPI003FD2EE1A
MAHEPGSEKGSPDGRPGGRGGDGIPDGLLVGGVALLVSLATFTWSATGLAGVIAHGRWPEGVTFVRTGTAVRSFLTAPRDVASAWPDASPEQLPSPTVLWLVFLTQLVMLFSTALLVSIQVARWRERRRARRAEWAKSALGGAGEAPLSGEEWVSPEPRSRGAQAPEPPPDPAAWAPGASGAAGPQMPLRDDPEGVGPGRRGQPAQPGRPAQTGQSGQTDQAGHAGQPGQAGQPWGGASNAASGPAGAAGFAASTGRSTAEENPPPRRRASAGTGGAGARMSAGAPGRDVVSTIVDAPEGLVVVDPDGRLWSRTTRQRGRLGPVHVYDPGHLTDAPVRLRWAPQRGCEEMPVARRRAAALLAPVRPTEPVFQLDVETAETLLRCYLHAAALTNAPTQAVLRWSHGQEAGSPAKVLRAHRRAAPGASMELESALTSHPGRRDAALDLVGRALGGLEQLHIRQSCASGRVDSLALDNVEGEGGTLYVVGDHKETASLRYALLDAVLSEQPGLSLVNAGVNAGG